MVEHLPPLPWIILFAPLVSCILICLFALKAPKTASLLSLSGILVSLAGSVAMFVFHSHNTLLPAETTYPWFQIPGLAIEFGFLIDQVSILMLLIVSGVGSCIFLYSIGYMKGDSSYPRYFAYLSLFAFSMLGIVLANNFFMLFVFWELVAASSYLLIGFWFEKPAAADAGNKAFIVNRVADFGLVLGIFYVWMLSGNGGGERTFSFTQLSYLIPQLAEQGVITHAMMITAALLVFCGVVGKSAQFPLYIWLPDAMEGPTPVSALIHAATMVAAGVYMMTRSFFLVAGIHEALFVIAVIGAVTAILAGFLALVQNDIKKILAYSTVSQLGYMVLALGLGSSAVAMYHLTTHAFFKALLFLGAGAMIHSLHTQDIWEMGGLLKRMKVTAITFLIGTAALCGLPPLSGFFSKDEILTLAFEENRVLYGMALFTAALTAFYMTRAVMVAVLGHPRAQKHHGHGHTTSVHDAPLIMKTPLVILAILSVIAGFLGIPEFIKGEHGHGIHLNFFVAATSVLAAGSGILLGFLVYRKATSKEDPLIRVFGGLYDFVVKKYYLDHFFGGIGNFVQGALSKMLFWFDWNILIQRGVNGVAHLTGDFASFLRHLQTGRVQTYALVFGFGMVAILYFILLNPGVKI